MTSSHFQILAKPFRLSENKVELFLEISHDRCRANFWLTPSDVEKLFTTIAAAETDWNNFPSSPPPEQYSLF